MTFNFLDEEEEDKVTWYCKKHTVYRKRCRDCNPLDEEEEDEFIDLSDIFPNQDTEDGDSNDSGISEATQPEGNDEVEVDGFAFAFTDDVPEARSITDPEVRSKARSSRKRSPSARDYSGKRHAGWSLYCAHKGHLSNLCERAQDNGESTCSCSCHEERGYVFTEPESVSGGDEQEIVLSIG